MFVRVRIGIFMVLSIWITILCCSEKALELKMAVRVNGEGIPERRVNMIFDATMAQLPRSLLFSGIPEEAQAEVRRQIIEELIDQELLYQEAQKRGITVSDSLVYANMHKTEAFYRSEDQFEDQLYKMGITRENVEEDHRKDLIVEQYVDNQIGEISVSGRDIEDYYDTNKSAFVWQDAIHTRHILFRVPSGASVEDRLKAFEEAKEILARLKANEDFAALARACSEDDQTAPQGGDLGFIEKGRLVPEYEEAAAGLQQGEISDVVKTSFGYHIIHLVGRRKGGDIKTLNEVRHIIRILLVNERRQQQLRKIIEELRRHADILYESS